MADNEMGDSDNGMNEGNTSLEYGSGGRKIKVLAPDPGVVEGVSSMYDKVVENTKATAI